VGPGPPGPAAGGARGEPRRRPPGLAPAGRRHVGAGPGRPRPRRPRALPGAHRAARPPARLAPPAPPTEHWLSVHPGFTSATLARNRPSVRSSSTARDPHGPRSEEDLRAHHPTGSLAVADPAPRPRGRRLL